jgi:raffinose/stachyose/melibiose transport system substrate-binding protein
MTTTNGSSTRLSRRGFLAASGVGALGLALPGLLSACSSGGSSSGGAVKLWMDIAGTPNQKYFDDHVVDAFHKATGGSVGVTYYQGQDLRRLIQTALQAKSGPDVVRGASATQTLAWSQAKLLADLTEYERHYGWGDKLLPWSVDAFTKQGKLWAMPMRVDTMLLYYNKTLFADRNWTPPTNRDELEGLAQEAHGNGIIPFGASNVDWTAGPEWLMTVFWNHFSGPDALYQALTSQIRFTDAVFVDAVTLLKSYFDKGWFAGGTDKYFSVPSQEMGAQFGAGKIAMFPQGEWWMSALPPFFGKAAGNDNDWDWAPFPSLRSEVQYPLYEIGIGGSLGINAASRNKDAAAKFLNWYYTDRQEALRRMADVPATYNIPIPVQAAQVPGGIDPRSKRLLTAVNEAVAKGNYGYVTWTWWPAEADVYVYEGLQQVLTGKSAPKDYCAQLDSLFRKGVAAGAVPQIIKRTSGQ